MSGLFNWFNQLWLLDGMEILNEGLAWLPLATLIISSIVVFLWLKSRIQRGKALVADEAALRRMFVPTGMLMRNIVMALCVWGLVLIAAAVTDPAALERVPKDEAYIELTLDVSDSMLQDDIEPNRLSGAKAGAQHFLTIAPEEGNINIGVVTYHGQVNELIAPTTDYERISMLLETVQAGAGTAIGDALLRANDELSPFTEGTPADELVPAAIVLLSDGESTTGSAVSTALNELQQSRIPVHTIGYAVSEEQASQEQLQEIATATGGVYLTADSPEQLAQVFEQLAYTSAFETTEHSVASGYAGVGLLVLVLAIALGMLATRSPLVNPSKTETIKEEVKWPTLVA